eukprot:1981916-Pyramimonas_sp.AAC.2
MTWDAATGGGGPPMGMPPMGMPPQGPPGQMPPGGNHMGPPGMGPTGSGRPFHCCGCTGDWSSASSRWH